MKSKNTHTCGSHICLKSEGRWLEMQTPDVTPELQACQGALLQMVWKPHSGKGKTLETRAWVHPQTHVRVALTSTPTPGR